MYEVAVSTLKQAVDALWGMRNSRTVSRHARWKKPHHIVIENKNGRTHLRLFNEPTFFDIGENTSLDAGLGVTVSLVSFRRAVNDLYKFDKNANVEMNNDPTRERIVLVLVPEAPPKKCPYASVPTLDLQDAPFEYDFLFEPTVSVTAADLSQALKFQSAARTPYIAVLGCGGVFSTDGHTFFMSRNFSPSILTPAGYVRADFAIIAARQKSTLHIDFESSVGVQYVTEAGFNDSIDSDRDVIERQKGHAKAIFDIMHDIDMAGRESVTFNRRELIRAAEFCRSPEGDALYLSSEIGSDSVKVSFMDWEHGRKYEDRALSVGCESHDLIGLESKINRKYLIRALRVFTSELVEVQFNEINQPIMFTSVGNPHIVGVMPMR